MPNQRKIQIVQDLNQAISPDDGLFLTSSQGLTISEVDELRGNLRQVGAQYRVVKNTLLDIVFKSKELSAPADVFSGPTALIIASGDKLIPLKSIATFVKTHDKLTIKGGIFEGNWLSGSQLTELAALPSREVLVGRALGLIQSPLARLAYVTKSKQSELVYILSTIVQNKQS